jgi:hypothetical protein
VDPYTGEEEKVEFKTYDTLMCSKNASHHVPDCVREAFYSNIGDSRS